MQVFEALADPTRRRILVILSGGELAAGALGERFAISRPAVSRHLRVLREAGLVQCRSEAQKRVYSLDPAPLEELDRWLDSYRSFWTSRLDALEAHLRGGPETHD